MATLILISDDPARGAQARDVVAHRLGRPLPPAGTWTQGGATVAVHPDPAGGPPRPPGLEGDTVPVDAWIDRLLFGTAPLVPAAAVLRRPELVQPAHDERLDLLVLDVRGPAPCDGDLVGPAALAARCSLVTSLFRTDRFLHGFRRNMAALSGYDHLRHYLVFADTTEAEARALQAWRRDHANAVFCRLARDPGLYGCWNLGIALCGTPYVGNANVDDLRAPNQVLLLADALERDPQAAVAASAVVAFDDYPDDAAWPVAGSDPWYADEAGRFGLADLARVRPRDDGRPGLAPHNLPHCMPLWRTALHARHGLFDEDRHGTYADWALWLRVTAAGEHGVLIPDAVSGYYVNPTSHNRRGDRLAAWHAAIEDEFAPRVLAAAQAAPAPRGPDPADHVAVGGRVVARKLRLTGLDQCFGQHRNAFNRLVEALLPLQHPDPDRGVRLVPFIERTFVWGTDPGEAASSAPRPLTDPWIGIVHVPFDAPPWFEASISPERVFETPMWRASLPACRGLVCLGRNLARDLAAWYPDLPTVSALHPTDLDDLRRFDPAAYAARPRLVQVGDWLRRLQAIHEVRAPGHERVMLVKGQTDRYLQREIAVLGDRRDPAVTVMSGLDDAAYDELLSSSVVLCWLYATEANNVVIECIARGTPLLVNPLPSVVEYLGPGYPLYLESLDDVAGHLADPDRLAAASRYLLERCPSRPMLGYEAFLRHLAHADFYQQLRTARDPVAA